MEECEPEQDPELLHNEQPWWDGVLTISADAAKRLFPEYVKDPIGADRDVASSAEAISNAALRTVLTRAPEPGREMVLIAVGSHGSGKTATLTPVGDFAVAIKIEQTLDDLEQARRLMNLLLDSGRKPIILWIYVDDPVKTVPRMVARAKKIGRVDRIEDMSKAYAEVPKVLEELHREFSGRIKIHAADNSGAKGELEFIEDESRIWTPLEDAIATRVGLAQVDATNRMFLENPDFEVEY